jgi:hypothetical protein
MGAFGFGGRKQSRSFGKATLSSSPVASLVLAAALVEGALTFVVKHARSQGLGVLASKDFDREPRNWKIDSLVASAAHGGDSAILDGPMRQRAEGLINARQRVHAGKMLSEFPDGTAPDLRPDEARDAKEPPSGWCVVCLSG